MKNFGEQFLHQKDSKLHTSQPVEHEKRRLDIRGEETSQKPVDKIEDWLEVIKKTHTSHADDPRVLERIKNYYHRENVIKAEDVPESTFLLEQTIARNQGHGTIEITDEFRRQKTNEIISNQEKSLDKWVDYLSSPDATYPMWAKYWAFNSMLKMGKIEKMEDKETKVETMQFKKRTKDTVASFPTLNPRALAMTISAISAKAEQNSINKQEIITSENISKKLNEAEFKELINSENFSKIYAQFLIEMPEYSTEGLKETRGEWKTYKQGSAPDELVKSLDGHPLEWCTANIDTARTQLKGGDFHVYYSINEKGEAIIPRVAIRMESNNIAEVRGIAAGQNMDPYIGDVVKEKMTEFPDGEKYEKKNADMKRLTEIEEKNNRQEELSKDDLRFLYEIDSKIEGFGYEKDPRIQEIILTRKIEDDAPIVLEYQREEIAFGQEEYDNAVEDNRVIKAYIGPLFPQIFSQNLDHIYASFPNGRIEKAEITIGTKNKEELIRELEEREKSINPEDNIYISDYARSMLQKPEFAVINKPEKINLIKLKVQDLGLASPTTNELYKRAEELGLELCPPEIGPYLRLKYKEVFKREQNKGESLNIGVKQIIDSDDDPDGFCVNHSDDGKRWLGNVCAMPGDEWKLDAVFVFSRK